MVRKASSESQTFHSLLDYLFTFASGGLSYHFYEHRRHQTNQGKFIIRLRKLASSYGIVEVTVQFEHLVRHRLRELN